MHCELHSEIEAIQNQQSLDVRCSTTIIFPAQPYIPRRLYLVSQPHRSYVVLVPCLWVLSLCVWSLPHLLLFI